MKLENKVALITGASRGIGKATALLFAKEGAGVVVDYFVSDYEPDADANAKNLTDEIERLGGKAIAISADVSSEEEVKQLIEKTIDKFGRLDILVNNAGIVFDVPFLEKTVEQWQRTINTNLLGTFLCSKYASSKMLENGTGKIVNISSTNGISTPFPDSMDYDASKAGILMLTKNFANELAPAIQVNAIAPGWVDTEMNKDLTKEFVAEETRKIFMKRFAKPEEIAKAILFLASNDADYITGSTLVIDGGY